MLPGTHVDASLPESDAEGEKIAEIVPVHGTPRIIACRVCTFTGFCALPAMRRDHGMSTLHIEHPISDFVMWNAAFDRAAPLRAKGQVRAYDIHQPMDDPAYVMVRLEFDDEGSARAFLAMLEQLWNNPEAAPALRGVPRARVLERRGRG